MSVDVDKMKRAAAEAGLKQDGERVRANIEQRGAASLFDALESIGASVDPIWHGEWTGPILFTDPKGAQRLILVEQADHDAFDTWFKQNAPGSEEMQRLREPFKGLTDPFIDGLQEYGRQVLVRMCARPINPADYM